MFFNLKHLLQTASYRPLNVPDQWILLLYGLPARRGAARVNLWRQLKKCGALPLKTSAYLLPAGPEHHERLQWLAQQVRDGGGEATLIHVTEIEGLTHEEIVRQFNEARASDYNALIGSLNELIARNKRRPIDTPADELGKLARRLEDLRRIDFFDCARAQDAQMLLQRAAGLRGRKATATATLAPRNFRGRTWLTRPRPEIDRVGSAWLIRRFIDPKAAFVFGTDPAGHPGAIPYDMFEAEFSHHGDDCTFETLVKRFGIEDQAVRKIAEMVHDADLEDGKFQSAECIGIDRDPEGLGPAARAVRRRTLNAAPTASRRCTNNSKNDSPIRETGRDHPEASLLCGGVSRLAQAGIHQLRWADRPDRHHAHRIGRPEEMDQ